MSQDEQALMWWQTHVIYQIYPRSYKDSNGDGVGDLNGVIEKLDYLSQSLGVNAIWLSPFYPSPMVDFGYDVSNYTDVDPLFGDLATFDKLVEEAHQRGIKLIIDWIPNHSSDQHPWFKESRSSRENPKRDWYVWADALPDGNPPNNWLGTFGGSAWEWDEATGQYYLHSFAKEQPDLNWRNTELVKAMFDTVRFWLERGVDGLRIDAAHYILKDPEFRDNPPRTGEGLAIHKSLGEYDTQLHLYDKAHVDVHEIYRQLRLVIDEYSVRSPRVAIGEVHIFDLPEWTKYYGPNLDEMHMPFNFGLLKSAWNATAVRRMVDNLEGHLPEGAWPNYVLGNHDEARIASRLNPVQSRLAMFLLLLLRGTPTIYYGDELGMQNVNIPVEKVQDPWEKLTPGLNLGRDGARTPMQWDASPNAGFCPEAVSSWLPLAENYREQNVELQLSQPDSMLNFTRALLTLRRGTPALFAGDYKPVDTNNANCFVFERNWKDERYLVILNFSSEAAQLELTGLEKGELLISTHPQSLSKNKLALSKIELEGDEGWLVKLAG